MYDSSKIHSLCYILYTLGTYDVKLFAFNRLNNLTVVDVLLVSERVLELNVVIKHPKTSGDFVLQDSLEEFGLEVVNGSHLTLEFNVGDGILEPGTDTSLYISDAGVGYWHLIKVT